MHSLMIASRSMPSSCESSSGVRWFAIRRLLLTSMKKARSREVHDRADSMLLFDRRGATGPPPEMHHDETNNTPGTRRFANDRRDVSHRITLLRSDGIRHLDVTPLDREPRRELRRQGL